MRHYDPYDMIVESLEVLKPGNMFTFAFFRVSQAGTVYTGS